MNCQRFTPAEGGQWLLTSTRSDFELFTMSTTGFECPSTTVSSVDGSRNDTKLMSHVSGDRLEYDVLPFTFIIDHHFKNYTNLHNHLKRIPDFNTIESEDIVVTFLDHSGAPLGVEFQFSDAQIFQLGGFQLITNSEGRNVLTSTATFKFRDMTIKNKHVE